MQTRKYLMRKSSNIENTLVSSRGAPIKHIQGGMCRHGNGIHRIRRKVSGAKPYLFVDTPEQQLKKRFAKVRAAAARAELPTPPATPAPETSVTNTLAPPSAQLNLPRYLRRLEYKSVPRSNRVVIEPRLLTTPLPSIRDELKIIGPAYVPLRFFYST